MAFNILLKGLIKLNLAGGDVGLAQLDGSGLCRELELLAVHVVAVGDDKPHLHGLVVNGFGRKLKRFFGIEKVVCRAGRVGQGKQPCSGNGQNCKHGMGKPWPVVAQPVCVGLSLRHIVNFQNRANSVR
jgi:hypothetical protein